MVPYERRPMRDRHEPNVQIDHVLINRRFGLRIDGRRTLVEHHQRTRRFFRLILEESEETNERQTLLFTNR